MRITRGCRSGLCLFAGLMLLVVSLSQAFSPGQQPFRILISNDDGFQSPGIKALFDRLRSLGEVTVAAPAANQSLVGHGFTFGRPINIESWETEGSRWFAIAATPATCVRMALTSLLPHLPDIVVSGINKGENTGVVTFSSGTVSCAREAAYRDIPAIAVSCGGRVYRETAPRGQEKRPPSGNLPQRQFSGSSHEPDQGSARDQAGQAPS